MTDGVNIDFGLLKQPDYVGDYVNAFNVGRGMARPAALVAAGNAFEAAPGAAGGSVAPTPDEDLAERVGGMNPAERARAGRQAELLGAIGAGLAGVPYAQRRSVLVHMTPALAARGVDPAQIAAFDPTDANLGTAVARARSLAGLLVTPSAD